MGETGYYIHIPFCAVKCGYCDFLSFSGDELWENYCDALISEIKTYKTSMFTRTLYIGGGTPTIWPATLLEKLLVNLPAAEEITCEANPGTLTAEKIAVLKKYGVNRVSLGLQAWQPRLLKNIGRKQANFLESFYALRNAGFDNINIDLMFALPGQSLEDWQESLREVCALNPEHISAYALTPTEVDDETDRQMYHNCKAFLREQGYMQYEISNFCKPGFQSRHNLIYWTRQAYRGFGLGAHSFEENARFHNTEDMSEYLKGGKQIFISKIDKEEALSEHIFLGLRMTKGIRRTSEMEKYSPWIEKMKNDGLLQENNGHIALSDRGMDLANLVMSGFLA